MYKRSYRKILKKMPYEQIRGIIEAQKLNAIKSPESDVFKNCLHMARLELARRARIKKKEEMARLTASAKIIDSIYSNGELLPITNKKENKMPQVKPKSKLFELNTKENARPFDEIIQKKYDKLEKAVDKIDDTLKNLSRFIEKMQSSMQTVANNQLDMNTNTIGLDKRIKLLEDLQPKPEIYNDFIVSHSIDGRLTTIFYGNKDGSNVEIYTIENDIAYPLLLTVGSDGCHASLCDELASLQEMDGDKLVWLTGTCYVLSEEIARYIIDNERGKEEC